MASYSFTYTSTDIRFYVSGLSAGDTVDFVVRLTSDTNDRTIAEHDLVSTGSTMTMWWEGRLTPGVSYTCNVRVNDGAWLGGSTFTTPKAATRPSNWSWQSTISSGSKVAITASEWNSFCGRINAFREYKGLSTYYFTSAYTGDPIYYWMANQLITAIDEIPGHGTLPDTVYSGSVLYASFFNTLKNALNAIS